MGFCGSSSVPRQPDSFESPGAQIPGEIIFVQRELITFDGMSIIQKPSNFHPSLTCDLTLFAVVCQEPQNDGYVIGKESTIGLETLIFTFAAPGRASGCLMGQETIIQISSLSSISTMSLSLIETATIWQLLLITLGT